MDRIRLQAEQLLKVLRIFNVRKTLALNSYTFQVSGRAVGIIRPENLEVLKEYTDEFVLEDREVKLRTWKKPDEITENLRKLLRELHEAKAFPALRAWRNEDLDVKFKFGGESLFRIERSMTYIFGLKRYGVHINGYSVDSAGNQFCWLQRRARTKAEYPGMLDTLVGGALPSGSSVEECLIGEASDEASIPRDLVDKSARPVGHVSFLYEDHKGLSPEILFCYDALLPKGFQPKCKDGEVDAFVKVPFGNLLDIVIDEEKFSILSLPVLLDFLIRHHILDHRFGEAYFRSVAVIHENLHDEYPAMLSQI
ncbi:nudix hydrolase 24, chloroplastic [Galendromus occidentalis]|uniref:Nudix hydrolase 24, chloroplastic n=1 Tax=Galendromus occidentalis TaxID=34638 RepID=A0AAJ6VYV0_9ACAR|nr:nudix hydrolase 24, chloroplastic [Galendromus occidentalis]